MAHSGRTRKGMDYASTPGHPRPAARSRSKPAEAGSRTAPSARASATAKARSKGVRGAEMRSAPARSRARPAAPAGREAPSTAPSYRDGNRVIGPMPGEEPAESPRRRLARGGSVKAKSRKR